MRFNGPGFDSRSERCIYRASRPSQGTVNGVPSLNDLAVDGTLNTTNQPTNVTMHCKIIIILYKECCAEMAYIFDKVNLEIYYKILIC